MNRPLRGPYRVVLCDVGETLVHYKRSFSATISAEAERLGAQVSLSEVRRIADDEYDRAIRDPAARGSSADAESIQGVLAGHVRRHGPSPGGQRSRVAGAAAVRRSSQPSSRTTPSTAPVKP